MTVDEQEALLEFRRRFSQDGCHERVHADDAARVLHDDWWLLGFLRSQSFDLDITKAVVLECIKWRMHFKPTQIGMLEMRSLLETGLMYIRGEDMEGNVILWINFVHHRNGDKEAERLLVYWLERFVMTTHGAPLAVVFNMHGAGLQNMDNDLIRFTLHCFKYYYPSVVRSILILETPQKLNPSWKVVRSWVDSSTLAMMHTVTRHSLAQYVEASYIPTRLGGEDDFAFSMDELARCIPPRVVVAASTSAAREADEMTIAAMPPPPPPRPDRADLDRFANGSTRRDPAFQSVKFDSEDSEDGPARSGPLILANNGNGNGRAPSTTRRQSHIPSTLKPIAEARINAAPDQWLETPVLLVCPSEELVLKKVEGENDSIEVVVLKNPSQKHVMYKIKTTSPEKFRVRPTAGIVKPDGMEIIRVYLQNEYKSTVAREKFLIMAMETETQPNGEDFAALWKEAPDNTKILQKLRCSLCENNAVDANVSSPSPPLSSSPLLDDTKDLRAEVKSLANQQRFLLLLIFVLVALQVLSLLYNRFAHAALSDQITACMEAKTKLAKDEL
uniref:Major sperm protein n=1 Tax=Steinernema glaseri TaxID=37863 RepID=A0A1I7YKH9_9BILA